MKNKFLATGAAAIAALCIVIAGCKYVQPISVNSTAGGEGTASIKITAAANSPFSKIARGAVLTISASDMLTMTKTLSVTDSTVTGTISGIPAGKHRLFQVNVFDSLETIQYRGSAYADVIADSIVMVTLSIIRVGGGAIINGTVVDSPGSTEPIPTAFWSFDSTSANTYYDITGHGYNATATGIELSLVSGVLGKALSCPASGFEITVANSIDTFAFKKFSVETWYNPNIVSTSGQLKILEYNYTTSGVYNGWTLCIIEQGIADFTLASNTSSWMNAQSTTALTPNKWYHLVGSYDGSYIRLYVNGVLERTVSYSGGVVACGANARLGCQRLSDGTVRWGANGKIDELKVYNFALSDATIKAHYNAVIVPQ